MKIQEKEISAYEKEYQDTLAQMKKAVPPYKEVSLLMKAVEKHFSLDNISKRHPKVIVLGSGIPEELIYALDIRPYWILGGSLQTGAWAGDMAPRDADPVSRSMLGTLLGLEHLSHDALVLLPIVSDSTRKLAYLLRRAGWKVHTIDIPPVKSEWAEKEYVRQIELCAEAISNHTGKRLTRRALRESAELAAEARQEMRRFLQITDEKPNLLSAPWRMLILFSFYCVGNIRRWTELLAKLNERMAADRVYRRSESSGDVLLMGSPVYFPNYKIPFLLQDAGLRIRKHLDYTTEKFLHAPAPEDARYMTLTDLAVQFYQTDCSGAYAKNDTLQEAVANALSDGDISGVVYCVLKGQIEYDFELERVETLCNELNIPVFRLETDYNQQDVEQLRIRMEAFSEMLRQRQYQRGVAV
ncbi:MAG: 2-hydroxyacyl-CoA dehydratase family protein [Oscillospiraceae bacterium]|nr:2-hydroxyacyl-CoA dehydratase family protein [Oscillospiraceae bacterium]